MSENNICPHCDQPLDVPPSEPGDRAESASPRNPFEAAEGPVPSTADNQAAPEEDAAPDDSPEVSPQDRGSMATTRLPQATPIFAANREEPTVGHESSSTGVPLAGPEEENAQETREVPEPHAAASEAEESQEPEEPEAEPEAAPPSPLLTGAAGSEEGKDQEPEDLEEAAGAAPPGSSLAEAVAASEEEAGQEPEEAESGAEIAPQAVDTEPHLEEEIGGPAEPEVEASEMPTARFERETEEPPQEPGSTVVAQTPRRQTGLSHPAYIVPPAPYTPPPVPSPPPPAWITPPAPAYAAPVEYGYASPGEAYLQQRVQAYIHGGYHVHVHGPHEATLSCDKHLGVGGWLLALVTVIGFFWYLLILVVSGFQSDKVYIVLEPDGRVYEDGPGAAHVRRQRSRTGRRWSAFGLIVFAASLVMALVLGAVGAVFLTQDRYQAALREAYPAVTLFEEHFSSTQANPGDVSLAKDGAVVYAILAGITVVGLWGGATLLVVGTIHASAYHTRVPPLPALA
jgi:hypothetical protein